MLVVPALSSATVDSLYQILINGIKDFKHIFAILSLSQTGAFFIIMVIQSSSFSFGFFLLRIPELLQSFSPFIADFRRKLYVKFKDRILIEETDLFQYGYNYASMVTVLYIILTFGATVPLINASGFLFFSFKFFVDGYNLLVMHR
jgi:hypothetical protein